MTVVYTEKHCTIVIVILLTRRRRREDFTREFKKLSNIKIKSECTTVELATVPKIICVVVPKGLTKGSTKPYEFRFGKGIEIGKKSCGRI